MAVTLPWLLAGPIIRRAEPDVVWIWLATSWSIVECQPWVIVTTRRGEKFDDVGLAAPADAWPDQIDPQKRLHEVFESGFRCVPLGQRLFVTLVPLRPKRPFARGTIYGYGMSLKLSADGGELKVELAPGGPLGKPVLLSSDVIAYQPWKWPTFSLSRSTAPFVHGSCRRPGAAGDDAYPTLHAWLVPEMARDRPQAVFLTGDQIYADDLAGPLWGAIQDLARDLLGTVELMPLLSRVQAVQEYRADTQARPISDFQYTPQSQVKQPPPYTRSAVARAGGFVTDDGEGHLLGFSEFAGHYLLQWSPELYDLYRTESRTKPKGKADEQLRGFKTGVVAARKVLANLPVYMIFDDHDVTDDWNYDDLWSDDVYNTGNPLGRWIVTNALTAYWAFQAWGNEPASFDLDFITTVQDYAEKASQWTDPSKQMENSKEFTRCTKLLLERAGWSYIAPTVPPAVVVDTRTQREGGRLTPRSSADFDSHRTAAILVGTEGRKRLSMLLAEAKRRSTGRQLLLVLPAPLLGWSPMKFAQEYKHAGTRASALTWDWEQFHNNPLSVGSLLDTLSDTLDAGTLCVIFSGDVHHGYVSRGRYYAFPRTVRARALRDRISEATVHEIFKWMTASDTLPADLGSKPVAGIDLLQITASPIKNIHERFHSVMRRKDENWVWMSKHLKDADIGEVWAGVAAAEVFEGETRVWAGISAASRFSGNAPPGSPATAVGFNNLCVVNLADPRVVRVLFLGPGRRTIYKRWVDVPRVSRGLR